MSEIHSGGDGRKQASKAFWNRNVNQSRYIQAPLGSDQFFKEGEQLRYRYHYHIPVLLSEIAQTKPVRLLEIGCGMANDLVYLARLGVPVYGVDLSERAIELAKRHFELENLSAVLQVADAENLPFQDNFFSAVYSFGVLHHTPNIERAIQEVYRVLTPGGTAYVMLYNKRSLNYMAHLALRAPYDGTRKDRCPVETAFTKTEVKKLFRLFRTTEVKVDYLFGTGWGVINSCIPTFLHRTLGRAFGWHLMVRSTK